MDLLASVRPILFSRLFLLGLGVISSLFIANVLSPIGYGIVATINTIGFFLVLISKTGLEITGLRRLSRRNKSRVSGQIISSTLAGSALTMLTGWLIFVLVLSSGILDEIIPSGFADKHGVLAAILLVYSLGAGLMLSSRMLAIGHGKDKLFSSGPIYRELCLIAGLAAIYWQALISPVSILILQVSSTLCVSVLLIYVLRDDADRKFYVNKRWLLNAIRSGYSSQLAGQLKNLLLRIDILMVQYFLGNQQVGIYAVSALFAEKVMVLPNSAFPIILRAASRGTDHLLAVQSAVRLCLLATCIAGLIFMLMLLLIIEYLLPEYRGSGKLILILFPAMIAYSGFDMLSGYLIGNNASGPYLNMAGTAFIANVIINIILIPWIGVEGAAISSAICYGFAFCGLVRYLKWGEVKEIGGPHWLLPRREDIHALRALMPWKN